MPLLRIGIPAQRTPDAEWSTIARAVEAEQEPIYEAVCFEAREGEVGAEDGAL